MLAGDPYIHPKKVILISSLVIPNLFSFLLLYLQELLSDFQASNQHSSYVYPHLFNLTCYIYIYIFFICTFLVFKLQAPNPPQPDIEALRHIPCAQVTQRPPVSTSGVPKPGAPLPILRGNDVNPPGSTPGWKNRVPIGCCLARWKFGFQWWLGSMDYGNSTYKWDILYKVITHLTFY